MKILFSLGLMVLAAGSVFAETEEKMTRDLYEQCTAKNNDVCYAYVNGLLDGGWAGKGCYDMESEIPSFVTPTIKAFVKYVKKHPELLDDTAQTHYATEAIEAGLVAEYPCAKDSPQR